MTIYDDIIEGIATLDERLQFLSCYINSPEWWWGEAAVPTSKNVIERNVDNPFRCISGNDTWGAAVLIVGPRDDPAPKLASRFHIHRIDVAAQSEVSTWRIRFLYGVESLEEAAQAQRWTETMVTAQVSLPIAAGGSPVPVQVPALPCRRAKVWAQAWNATNAATIDFYFGCYGHDAPCYNP